MYDEDGNGYINLTEMTKIIQSIYNMMGPNDMVLNEFETPEAGADDIFKRMDVDSDGKVSMEEFASCCLKDQKMIELLTARRVESSDSESEEDEEAEAEAVAKAQVEAE
jgi:hypothetical protein